MHKIREAMKAIHRRRKESAIFKTGTTLAEGQKKSDTSLLKYRTITLNDSKIEAEIMTVVNGQIRMQHS
ncbi:hypothetical protein [Peribacillus simplex]|uniref:hypothetical protein n=1 Tax=Peribacillus simplex TaxID=1478 RepID=UPI0024C17065|nr:hypothetical protein [Peribacillus simplex]WHY58778.1 hypothetical protein QNH43_11225 [Peribacillus simplex]